MPLDPLSLAGFAVGAVGSLVSGISARKQARNAAGMQRRYEQDIARLESSRQAVIDPYAGVVDNSALIRNPFANLQVATQAAQMQATEADISLASTLDTLRATGAGAGGATALAQAAARSKQGIAASIEKQEAANALARAQGEQSMQTALLAESARVQEARARGQQFVFGAQETREMQQLNRTQNLQNQYAMIEAQARSQAGASFGSALGGLAAFTAGGGFQQGAFKTA